MRRRLPLVAVVFAGAAAFIGGSWLLARALARRLISPQGLAPPPTRREDLLSALRAASARVRVEDLRFSGAEADPVELAAVFASPDASGGRGTIVFLHGKGGNAAEWTPDAVRSIEQGFSVLVPDLRGHPPSGGDFVTYGLLERDDLRRALAAAGRYGLDPSRVAIHSCSAGSWIALAWAAEAEKRVRGLWLESPFADAREMARHYLAILSGLPPWVLGLTTRLAVSRALGAIRRSLAATGGAPSPPLDSLAAVERVRAPIQLVYGERDQLVPPRFTARLVDALPPGSGVWSPSGAGHCHHDDQPANVAVEEYRARWTAFFDRVFESP
jgi:pimeloyl-ACP methyl ester carboxylesterase